MTNAEIFTYTLCLVAMTHALVTALLLALYAKQDSFQKWVGPTAFVLIAIAFSAGVIGTLQLYNKVAFLAGIQIPMLFLIPPALYAFAVVISPFEKQIYGHWFWHTIPAACAAVLCLIIFLGPIEEIEPWLTWLLPRLWPFFALQAGIYLALSVNIILRDVQRLDDIFSFHGSRAEERLKRFVIMLALPWFLLVFDLLLHGMFTLSFEARATFEAIRVVMLIGIFIIPIYPSPLIPLPKEDVPKPERALETETNTTTRYQRSKIDQNAAERIALKLEHLMQDKKPFLDPFLTLQDLSDQSGISKHKISQTLNVHLQKSFFEYTNEWRVQYVIEQFEAGRTETLTQISLEAGFNSKSTFNKAFKAVTGLTPTKYREIRL